MANCMDKKALTQEEAMQLLFGGFDESTFGQGTTNVYTDQYGDYVYPTDLVASKPNTAYGSSGGFDYLCLLENVTARN